MKRTTWLLLSLALNIGLLGALVLQTHVPPAAVPSAAIATAPTPPQPSPARTALPVAAAPSDNGDWHSWLDELRRAGVPDKVLSQLVAAEFDVRWQKQAHDLQRRYNRGEVDDFAITRNAVEHDSDLEAEMKAALGADAFLKWDKARTLETFDQINLTPSEQDAAYQLHKQLADAQHDLQEKNLDGQIDQSELDAKESAAEQDYDKQLKALLGDDRFAALQNPGDAGRAELMRSLSAIQANDSQLQALLQTQQQFTQSRAALEQDNQGGNALNNQLQALDAQRNAEFEQVLGTNAFAQLQMQEDSRYQQMEHYKTAWQLSSDDINYVYNTLQSSQQSIQDYEQQAKDLEAQGQSVDWNAVQTNIQQFNQQTQHSLQTYLGDDRFSKLKNSSILDSGITIGAAN